jgi:hypothetical protein
MELLSSELVLLVGKLIRGEPGSQSNKWFLFLITCITISSLAHFNGK